MAVRSDGVRMVDGIPSATYGAAALLAHVCALLDSQVAHVREAGRLFCSPLFGNCSIEPKSRESRHGTEDHKR